MRLEFLLLIVLTTWTTHLFAWGDPHYKITWAALKVQPGIAEYEAIAGKDAYWVIAGELNKTGYCGMPDNAGRDRGDYFADDYLFRRGAEAYFTPHTIQPPTFANPGIDDTMQRAFQAFRTEEPVEAFRWLGSVLHYVEDCGAPPHALPVPGGPLHVRLDNGALLDKIEIPGYLPQLLGNTEEEAITNIKPRLMALYQIALKQGKLILPLAEAERWKEVDELGTVAALECARAAADVIHTYFTLGLRGKENPGVEVSGKVIWPELVSHQGKGARVLPLRSEQLRGRQLEELSGKDLYDAGTPFSTFSDREGKFRFHHLPEGEYRLLISRVGAKPALSAPLRLTNGSPVRCDVCLHPSNPVGNLVLNGDLQVSWFRDGMPDYWLAIKPSTQSAFYLSSQVFVSDKMALRCGAALKDPAAKIKFMLLDKRYGNAFFLAAYKPDKKNALDFLSNATVMETTPGVLAPPELRYDGSSGAASVLVVVESKLPLKDAVERVWIVPEK